MNHSCGAICLWPDDCKEREALEAFVVDFRRMVDNGAIVPKSITTGFARLCHDAVRLTPSLCPQSSKADDGLRDPWRDSDPRTTKEADR